MAQHSYWIRSRSSVIAWSADLGPPMAPVFIAGKTCIQAFDFDTKTLDLTQHLHNTNR